MPTQIFTVAKCTQTKNNSFCIKLVGTKSRSLGAFGQNVNKKTYYLYANQPQQLNTQHQLDTSKLVTYNKPFEKDGVTYNLEIITEILA